MNPWREAKTATERAQVMAAALVRSEWNVTCAAKLLGIHRQALQRELRRYGGVVGLRRMVEAVAPATGATDATDATHVAPATNRENGKSGGATRSADVALTYDALGPILERMETVVAPTEAFKSTTVPLSREEWLWLRRRAEQEADL